MLSEYIQDKAGVDEGVEVQGKIGKQEFGLVLQESRSSQRKLSRSNLVGSASNSQTLL